MINIFKKKLRGLKDHIKDEIDEMGGLKMVLLATLTMPQGQVGAIRIKD